MLNTLGTVDSNDIEINDCTSFQLGLGILPTRFVARRFVET